MFKVMPQGGNKRKRKKYAFISTNHSWENIVSYGDHIPYTTH